MHPRKRYRQVNSPGSGAFLPRTPRRDRQPGTGAGGDPLVQGRLQAALEDGRQIGIEPGAG